MMLGVLKNVVIYVHQNQGDTNLSATMQVNSFEGGCILSLSMVGIITRSHTISVVVENSTVLVLSRETTSDCSSYSSITTMWVVETKTNLVGSFQCYKIQIGYRLYHNIEMSMLNVGHHRKSKILETYQTNFKENDKLYEYIYIFLKAYKIQNLCIIGR